VLFRSPEARQAPFESRSEAGGRLAGVPDERRLPQDLPPQAERPGADGLLSRAALDLTPLRESRDFRNLWLGQVVSFVGSEITMVAIPFQLYELTHSTLQVGLLGLCDLVPLLTLAVLGGAIADALERRRLLLRSEAALALVSGLLALHATVGHPRPWVLYVLATCGGALASLSAPAMRSLMPRLVRPDQLAAASALESVYFNVGAVGGPAVAGFLIAVVGLPLTYVLDTGSYAASLVALWSLPAFPPSEDVERAGWRSMREGLAYVRSKPEILGIFLIDSNAMVFGMPKALFPALAARRFHGGASVVGLLYAAPYAGALVASLLSGWTGRVRRQGRVVAVAAACWGLALVAFGYAAWLPLALGLLALAGAADLVSATLRTAILFSASPPRLQGRLAGIELAQVASAPTLGDVEAGAVAAVTSLRFSIVSGGILAVLGTGLIALALPALRRYEAVRGQPEPLAPTGTA